MRDVIQSTSREDALTEVACFGTHSVDFSDNGIAAARKLLQQKPSPSHRALLSYVLYDRGQDEDFIAMVSEKDSPAEANAKAESHKFLTEASREATDTRKVAKGTDYLLASYVLGAAKDTVGEYAEAVSFQSQVANSSVAVCDTDITRVALRNLIRENDKAQKPDESERWFRQYANSYSPTAYDWDSEGDRRHAANDHLAAAEAYEKAAAADQYYQYDYCFATTDRYIQSIPDQDNALLDGRRCVDASVKNTTKGNEHFFKDSLPTVYWEMADVLNRRGVYPTALQNIKESISGDPQNAYAYYLYSQILENLERYSECTSAAQEAIRLSDGKYPFMQFQLGQCYFDSNNWSQAASSYRIAAEADKSDAGSAFNLGLCLARQGFQSDAQQWFRETLNRNPSSELRSKALNALK
jgi:tetratricopeptide (TPR) repeat protein